MGKSSIIKQNAKLQLSLLSDSESEGSDSDDDFAQGKV